MNLLKRVICRLLGFNFRDYEHYILIDHLLREAKARAFEGSLSHVGDGTCTVCSEREWVSLYDLQDICKRIRK